MTSILPPAFDENRRQSMAGMHTSSTESPHIHRPPSQQSLPLANSTNFSPELGHADHQLGFSAYPAQPQAFRAYQPASLALAGPNTYLTGGYPNNAPALPYFPNTIAPLYDPRGSQPMVRTISHAHPMNSATDRTASSRYSSSPHSATGPLMEPSPTASGQQLNPYPVLGFHQPSFTISNADKHDQQRMVNPALFANQGGYTMSRSTSGASDTHEVQRLMTPGLDVNFTRLSPGEQELRKVSDALGDPTRRFYTSTFTPSFDLQAHSLNLGPHPQPEGILYAGRGFGNDHFNLSSDRADDKTDVQLLGETEYERERQAQILNNRKLLAEVGLSGSGFAPRSRNASGYHGNTNRKSSAIKKRLQVEAPMRASPRLRQMSRTVSYADFDGGLRAMSEESDDEYASEVEVDDEDDFRPSKRTKGHNSSFPVKSSSYATSRTRVQLSLYGLLQVYCEIPRLFPLFYYTLNNDLTINSDSVPLIGSIPSTCTPLEKADMLQAFFHRGKRVQAQLDAFTSRCDKKYEGTEVKWPELDFHTRIAIRDVRRKVVERCENYKYTRRDILDKVVGKNKWQPIENGMIEWHPGMAQNDPAGDLINVTLTLPTPPPDMFGQQVRSASSHGSRSIKPLPLSRSRIVSAAPRTVSVNMTEPDDYALRPHTAATYASSSGVPMYTYPTAQPPPPMYGEDQVPMTVQLAGSSSAATAPLDDTTSWDHGDDMKRGIKRSRSGESGSPEA